MSKKLPIGKKVALYLSLLLLLFSSIILVVQYIGAKKTKHSSLNEKLTIYTQIIDKNSSFPPSEEELANIRSLINDLPEQRLRITMVGFDGTVLFDSEFEDPKVLSNHSDRPEIMQAARSGRGFNIRHSISQDEPYYYLAKRFDNIYIRAALPYTKSLKNILYVDIYSFLLIAILFVFTLTVTLCISRLFHRTFYRFCKLIQSTEDDQELGKIESFGIQELDNVSEEIVSICARLKKTKTKLTIEKQKIFHHLYISREGLAIFDREHNLTLHNELFIQYINLIAEEPLSDITELFNMEVLSPILEFLNETQNAPMQSLGIVRESIRIESHSKIFNIQCILFSDKGFEISINDVTVEEQHKLLKREMTQNIAHELRTPVSSIQGYLETLLSVEAIDEEKKRFFIERSYNQCIRLSHLVTDIGLLNDIDNEKPFFERKDLSLKDLILSTTKDIELQMSEKNVSVDFQFPEEMTIHGSYSLIYSIFRNLLDNSLAYAGKNFQITIKCYHSDDQYFYFSYSDNGEGVSEAHLNRLFDRFYRVDVGRTRKSGGTGLGLAIVKHAVLFHQGTILAKQGKEKGLEFLFSLHK